MRKITSGGYCQLNSRRNRISDLDKTNPPFVHLVKSEIEQQFRFSGIGRARESLRDTLGRFQGLFAISRYPFEPQADPSGFDLSPLMQVSEFLHVFVAQQEPVDIIEWI